MDTIPTRKLRVANPDTALEEILAFAKNLEESGERPWFEVWYPKPASFDGTDAEWDAQQADHFDAVEVIDGEINTLLPYSGLEGTHDSVA